MRKFFLTAAAFIAACAPPAAQAQQGPPKLVIVISVDQLAGDLWDQYRPHFTGGLARLAGGTVYRNGYQSHATTETCPGHAALITGTHPARNGIVGNSWTDFAAPRADKQIYCAENERMPGSDSDRYALSAVHLRVPALGDLLKRHSPASRVVAVSQKDRSAVMFGGHSPDGVFFLEGKAFTSAYKSAAPASLAAVNRAVAAQIARAEPALAAPPVCTTRARSIAVPEHAPVGAGTLARAAGDAAGWRASPASDGAALALSAALVRELKLGQGAATDLLAIGLAATDYVGHSYGSEGQEMCLQLLELDRELGDFFARLDGWGVDYAVALSADHGVADIPERARLQGVAGAARIDPDLTPKRISAAVRAEARLKGPILADAGVIGDLYLDPALTGADRSRALAAAIAAYRRHPQVEAAFAKAEIAATPVPSGDPARWSLIERVRASFDAARSGDLYVVLKPNITPIGHATGSVATHGSPWDYDRRVPILFWRRGAAAADIATSAQVVDIVPTVAAMLGLSLAPAEVDGRCLADVWGITCQPR